MARLVEGRFARWWLVAVAAVAMGMAGTYQFAWSSIRFPLGARLGASETALGTVFTVFAILQTVSQFPAGWVRDRWGPRPPLAAGAVLIAGGYLGTAWAPSITAVYLFYALGGIGAGTTYTVAVNTPVKWFDDRRGLATGVVAFAYPGLSVLLIPLVRSRITADFVGTMLGLAAIAGVMTMAGVPFLRDPTDTDPGPGDSSEADAPADPAGYTWRETIRTWQFWLLYGVFVIVHGVGLMIIGKVVAFSEASGLPAAAATGAASLVALGGGGGVIVGGTVSDRTGPKLTIALSLVACGASLAGAVVAADSGVPGGFVALIAAAAFFRSPVFSVFPSLVGDYYGTAHSSENYALLYSSKLFGAVVGGTATSALIVALGWDPTFLLGAGLLVAAGVAAMFLAPVERRRR